MLTTQNKFRDGNTVRTPMIKKNVEFNHTNYLKRRLNREME